MLSPSLLNEGVIKLSQLKQYAQTGTAVVAIIGIFRICDEVRQTNRQALAEANSSAWSYWADAQLSLLESGLATTEAKAMTAPGALTTEDKITQGRYLEAWVHLYQANITETYILGIEREFNFNYILNEIALEAPKYFGGQWS
jgi:hypothetical protein